MTTRRSRRDMLKDSSPSTSLALLDTSGVGAACPRPGRDAGAFHRRAADISGARPGEPPIRHPHDRRPVQPGGSFLHDPALRSSCRRSGGVPAESDGAGEPAAVAVARRAAQDRQHRTDRRLRMFGQSASAAGSVRQRTMDRRAAARRARSGRRSSRRRASSSSSAPIAARKRWSSGRRSSPSNSSTGAA